MRFANLPSSRPHHRHGGRWLTLTAVLAVLAAAAFYIYGRQVRVVMLLNQGRTYWQQGRLDQALSAFNQVLAASANHAQAIDAIGLVYLSQGDLQRAEIKYEQAVRLGLKFNRRFHHAKIADGFLSRGLYAPAELEFRHALELTPRDTNSRLGHALSLHALGRVSEALDAYRDALVQHPDLKLAQSQITLARQELERGFRYYIHDTQGTPLARHSLQPSFGARYYPLMQYAAHLIGFASAEHGSAGLEKMLEPYLPGNSVTLTVNADWQRAADRALGWRKGSLVAIAPATGEILASVNHPSFNPNRVDEDWVKIERNKNRPLLNRAFEGLYEPGSIFKIITASAALESKVPLNRIFPVNCSGGIRYNGQTFWCWRRHGQVESLQSALDTSCNLAMAEVGFAVGPDRLYEFANRFGFGADLTYILRSPQKEWSFPIAMSTSPISSDQRFPMAEAACGLGDNTLITPLHAAMLAAAVANNGQMMSPYFIKEMRNIRGEVLAASQPVLLRTPISPETAAQIKAFMIDTVKHGIGKKAQVDGVTVAGKTGTTGDSRRGLNGWFICFAPAEAPRVAVAIYTEHEGTGMDVAAPIARLFLQEILR